MPPLPTRSVVSSSDRARRPGGANRAPGSRQYREQGADLVLLDIHMPEMDGIEVLAQLHAIAPRLPVILKSGGDQTKGFGLLDHAVLLGAFATLAKPFSLDELLGASEPCPRGRRRPDFTLRLPVGDRAGGGGTQCGVRLVVGRSPRPRSRWCPSSGRKGWKALAARPSASATGTRPGGTKHAAD
jgi:CheY-like chemotaxis protein